MRTIALLVACFCSTAFAQIDVPAEVSAYKPIVATVDSGAPEGSEQKLRWSATPGLSLVQVGEAVHIWGVPGKHKLACSVVWLQFETVDVGGQKVRNLVAWDMISHEREFTIIGNAPPSPPGPGPGPSPPPVPSPVPADDFDNLGQRVAGWAATLPDAARKHAPTLATIYETVASKYAAGGLKDPVEAAADIKAARDVSIPQDVQAAWLAGVFALVQEDVTKRWPLDRQSYAAYLRAISAGLRGVK